MNLRPEHFELQTRASSDDQEHRETRLDELHESNTNLAQLKLQIERSDSLLILVDLDIGEFVLERVDLVL